MLWVQSCESMRVAFPARSSRPSRWEGEADAATTKERFVGLHYHASIHLAEDASEQDAMTEAGRERARDDDDALAMLADQPEAIDDALQQAAEMEQCRGHCRPAMTGRNNSIHFITIMEFHCHYNRRIGFLLESVKRGFRHFNF